MNRPFLSVIARRDPRRQRCGESSMTTLRLGDAPVDIDDRQRMNVVTSVLDQIFNGDKKGAEREIGFVLLVFDYGEKEGRCECISNGAHPSVQGADEALRWPGGDDGACMT